jgi:hypothetical protein
VVVPRIAPICGETMKYEALVAFQVRVTAVPRETGFIRTACGAEVGTETSPSGQKSP